MSARVLNPTSTAMMTEIGRNSTTGSSSSNSRVMPSRAALARVRRDLFGPVDHAAAKAFAERELRAQAYLDAEKWGFDFKLEMPRSNSRYEWQAVPSSELIPEPYALRGMPYIKQHAPSSSSSSSSPEAHRQSSPQRSLDEDNRPMAVKRPRVVVATGGGALLSMESPTARISRVAISDPPATPPTDVKIVVRESERTPPQVDDDERVPPIGQEMRSVVESSIAHVNETTTAVSSKSSIPVTPIPAVKKKQRSITDFMKRRKRTLNGPTKSIEPPEKINRTAGQVIRS